jgi:dihydrofolate reductase
MESTTPEEAVTLDKFEVDELRVTKIPLKASVNTVTCPKCKSDIMAVNPDGDAIMGESFETSYRPFKCRSCDYEAHLPSSVGQITHENSHYDNLKNPIRDAFGHSGVIALIWARTHNGGIGHKGELPWGREFPTDLKWFKAVTSHNPDALLVVGRETHEALPPLPGRRMAVLTTKVSKKTPVPGSTTDFMYPDIPTLIEDQKDTDLIVIGGGYCYSQWMDMVDVMYETIIYGNYPVDTFCPTLTPNDFTVLDTHHIPNCDSTGKDVIFNVKIPNKVKGTLEEHIINARWNFPIVSKLPV